MNESLSKFLEKYKADIRHARQVEKLSLMIFDKTKDMGFHFLSEKKRSILQYGACLHDVGYFVAAKSHHKHGAKLIKSEDFGDRFNEKHQNIMACISRYHRGSLPHKEHSTYGSLEKKDQKVVEKLAGITKLADGLDRQHIELVKDLELKYNSKHNILWMKVIPKSPDFKLDLFYASRKKELFEKAFEVQLVLISG